MRRKNMVKDFMKLERWRCSERLHLSRENLEQLWRTVQFFWKEGPLQLVSNTNQKRNMFLKSKRTTCYIFMRRCWIWGWCLHLLEESRPASSTSWLPSCFFRWPLAKDKTQIINVSWHLLSPLVIFYFALLQNFHERFSNFSLGVLSPLQRPTTLSGTKQWLLGITLFINKSFSGLELPPWLWM